MAKACAPLEDLMNRTDAVHILAPGTDLKFSIKGIGAVACTGDRNIPGWRVFQRAGARQHGGDHRVQHGIAVSGAGIQGHQVHGEEGKDRRGVRRSETKKLNEILDTDEGARYFGEWALGFNPYVLHPMKDTLFDEKIAGSFHLTPGNAYDPPGGNGNKSAIHWDTVLIQRPDYGGGEIHFDGKARSEGRPVRAARTRGPESGPTRVKTPRPAAAMDSLYPFRIFVGTVIEWWRLRPPRSVRADIGRGPADGVQLVQPTSISFAPGPSRTRRCDGRDANSTSFQRATAGSRRRCAS